MAFTLNDNSKQYAFYQCPRLRPPTNSVFFIMIILILCNCFSVGVQIVNSKQLITPSPNNFTLILTPVHAATLINATFIRNNRNLAVSSSTPLQNQSSSNPMSFSKIIPSHPTASLHQQVFNLSKANSTNYTRGLLPGVFEQVIKNETRILNIRTNQSYTASSEAQTLPIKNQSVISTQQNYGKIVKRKVRNSRTNRKLVQNEAKTLLSSDGRKVLTILSLFEFSYNNTVKREFGESERLAAQMALDDINGNSNILPGYKLVQITNDTQVRM